MIFKNLDEITNKNSPVIIIGSGPAGISIALELEKKKIKTLIVEAGSQKASDFSQKYYEGKVIGDRYVDLSTARLRQFGGTSGHWGGICRPLDKYDFLNWPIKKSDLDNYLLETKKFLNIKNDFIKKKFNENYDYVNFLWSNLRIADNFFYHIKKSKYINLALNSSFIKFNGKYNSIESIDCFDNNLINLKAKIYVLACGGIENSRLMLWSRERNKSLFNPKLPIGKYWMDHPYHSIGTGIVSKKKFYDYLKTVNLDKIINLNCNNTFKISPNNKLIVKNQLLNTHLNIGYSEIKKNSEEKKFVDEIKCVAPKFLNQLFSEVKDKNLLKISLEIHSEQLPGNNRIELDLLKDKLGIPKAKLFWKREENIRINSRKNLENLANFFITKNIGRIAGLDFLFNDNKFSHAGGYHHMGGTRAGKNYLSSVVDENLKVHGIENLYISGSSVFPSSGHVNPTFTIVQLSFRLAEKLIKLI